MDIRCPFCGEYLKGEALPGAGNEIVCTKCHRPFSPAKAQTLKYEEMPMALSPQDSSAAAQASSQVPEEEVLPIGTYVGRHRIVRLLGRGGMGTVYEAIQEPLNRRVALKVLAKRFSTDKHFIDRFNREAQALANLNHPSIVAIHDMGNEGGLCYFAMEFVDGVNLRQVLGQKKLAPEEALRIVPQLCEALEYAHSKGIIHRDIKPENILMSRSGQVKIADFGLARIVKGETATDNITQTNMVLGTLDYMAPEQRTNPKGVDHRADIYSMGVVIYEMLTGDLPIGRFAAPSKKVTIDVRLDEVVLKTLETEPSQRYQRASFVKTDVDRIVATPSGVAASVPAPAGRGQAESSGKRGLPRAAIVVVGILLIPVGFILAAILWPGFLKSNSPTPQPVMRVTAPDNSREFAVPSGKKIVVTGEFLRVEGWDRSVCRLDDSRVAKVLEKPDCVEITYVSTDVTLNVRIPDTTDVTIENSTEVSVTGMRSTVKADLVSGVFSGKGLSGDVEVSFSRSGNITFEDIAPKTLSAKTAQGSIRIDGLTLRDGRADLVVGKDGEVVVSRISKDSSFKCFLKGDEGCKQVFGEGRGTVMVDAPVGSIRLTQADNTPPPGKPVQLTKPASAPATQPGATERFDSMTRPFLLLAGLIGILLIALLVYRSARQEAASPVQAVPITKRALSALGTAKWSLIFGTICLSGIFGTTSGRLVTWTRVAVVVTTILGLWTLSKSFKALHNIHESRGTLSGVRHALLAAIIGLFFPVLFVYEYVVRFSMGEAGSFSWYLFAPYQRMLGGFVVLGLIAFVWMIVDCMLRKQGELGHLFSRDGGWAEKLGWLLVMCLPLIGVAWFGAATGLGKRQFSFLQSPWATAYPQGYLDPAHIWHWYGLLMLCGFAGAALYYLFIFQKGSSLIPQVRVNVGGTQNVEVPAADRLVINCAKGDVKVDGWDGDKVQVVSGSGVAVSQNAERVEINSPKEDADIFVKAPRSMAVLVHVMSGDVSVRQMKSAVEVDSAAGDVLGEGLVSSVKVATKAGDIALRDVSGGAITVNTLSGDIDLSGFGLVSGAIRLNTLSGDIALRGARPDASFRYTLSTASGGVAVQLPTGVSERGGRIDGTIGGGIGTLEGATMSGNVSFDARGTQGGPVNRQAGHVDGAAIGRSVEAAVEQAVESIARSVKVAVDAAEKARDEERRNGKSG
jgi:serine/threonine protein kinase/DUF4097 and DUF4098 domain-containing protein YvlB